MGRGKPTEERTKRGFQIHWTIVAITLGLMTAAGGAGLLASPFLEVTERYKNDWLALALLASGLFTANMARMLQIWGRLKPAISKKAASRNESDRKIFEKGFSELFLYLLAVFAALTILTFASAVPGRLPWDEIQLSGPPHQGRDFLHVYVLLAALGLSLVPLLSGFFLQARKEAELFGRSILRSDAISTSSFLIGAILIGAMVWLASWAASVSPNETEGLAENLAFWITFAVVALFVAFIFLPHFQRYIDHLVEAEKDPNTRAQVPFPFSAPATFASWIDSGLVRFIAPLTGATQKGRFVPHCLVVLSLLPLAALGFILPQPAGLAPILVGILMIIALGRRWAWIEEDREIASRLLTTETREIQVGFDNDLKDEALLGYAFLFLLVPLALHQINGVVGVFTGRNGSEIGDPLFAWLSFFGGELAKAVPFVDWWEIYNVRIDAPVEPVCIGSVEACDTSRPRPDTDDLAKHLTFGSRAMVDLVIMAALFQAIGIWQRSRAQDKLYDAGQINHFDPFMEERFFKRGMRKLPPGSKQLYGPRHKFEKRIDAHLELSEEVGQVPLPYNPRRLGELLDHYDDEVKAGARWMVEHYGVLAGTPQKRLGQLAAQWRQAWYFGNAEGPAVKSRDKIQQKAWRREEKLKIEPLLLELAEDKSEVIANLEFRPEDVANLMQLITIMHGAVEFEFSRVIAQELLSQVSGSTAHLALAAQVCPKSGDFAEWEKRFEVTFGDAVRDEKGKYVRSRHGGGGLRATCYDAIATQSTGIEDEETTREVLDFLRMIEKSGQDKSQFAAAAREKAISRIEATLSPNQMSGSTEAPTREFETYDEDEDELEPA